MSCTISVSAESRPCGRPESRSGNEPNRRACVLQSGAFRSAGIRMALAKHTGETASDRDHMVETQLAGRGLSQPRVLEAMRQVPRELFVSPEVAEFAYHDTPLPIAEGQTISQPYVVALMIEAAGVKPGDHVLDVGTGSGYAAAAVSLIAAEVYTIERHQALADEAAGRL